MLHRGDRHVEHALLAVDDEVGEAADLTAVGFGYAHEFGDHVHGQLARELRDPVEFPCLHRGFEIAQGQFEDAFLEVGDAPRSESFGDEPTHAHVARVVHREEGHHLVGVGPVGGRIERDTVGAREPGVVAEGRDDVGVAGQGPEPEVGVVVGRFLFTEAAVGGIRVFVEGVVVRVEDHGGERRWIGRSGPCVRRGAGDAWIMDHSNRSRADVSSLSASFS